MYGKVKRKNKSGPGGTLVSDLIFRKAGIVYVTRTLIFKSMVHKKIYLNTKAITKSTFGTTGTGTKIRTRYRTARTFPIFTGT